MDAITLLKQDHKTVSGLFNKFEKLGDRAEKSKREIVGKIIEELSIHAGIEETIFYPAVRERVPDAEDYVLESLEEHHVVKWLLSELDGMSPSHERFDAKVTVLKETVEHHVAEEEDEWFPKVREAMGRKELQDLGNAMEAAKKTVPTRPHPRQPDTPPGNLVVGAAVGVVDRARKVGMEAVGRATRGR
jgi:hemerythrin superfamily protein